MKSRDNFYYRDIEKFKPLSMNEERELCERIQKGDRKAETKLINSNIRFVISVANAYRFNGIEFEDLVQIGNKGLIRAVKKFDATKNFKFVSYAVWWIRQAILQAISEQSRFVKLPISQTARIVRIYETWDRLSHRNHAYPTAEELSEESGLSTEDIVRLTSLNKNVRSIDWPINGTEDKLFEQSLPDEKTENMEDEILRDVSKSYINKILSTLSERERRTIKLYYGINDEHTYTLKEIASGMKITRERVRQIKERAIKSLRNNTDLLKELHCLISDAAD